MSGSLRSLCWGSRLGCLVFRAGTARSASLVISRVAGQFGEQGSRPRCSSFPMGTRRQIQRRRPSRTLTRLCVRMTARRQVTPASAAPPLRAHVLGGSPLTARASRLSRLRGGTMLRTHAGRLRLLTHVSQSARRLLQEGGRPSSLRLLAVLRVWQYHGVGLASTLPRPTRSSCARRMVVSRPLLPRSFRSMSVHHCDNLRGSGTGAELALHFVQIAGRRAFYTLSYLPSARAIWVIARVSLLLYRVINRDSLPHAIGRYGPFRRAVGPCPRRGKGRALWR